jgi:hypothetical protein
VGPQGVNPEAHLVVEEQVDFVWKQVPVIHGVSEAAYGAGFELVSDGLSGSRDVGRSGRA